MVGKLFGQHDLEKTMSREERGKRIRFRLILFIILMALLIYLFTGGGDSAPHSYSLHINSVEGLRQRITVFEEDAELANEMWERVKAYQRGIWAREEDQEIPENFFLEVYFSRSDQLVENGGRVQIYGDFVRVDGEKINQPPHPLFWYALEQLGQKDKLQQLVRTTEIISVVYVENNQEKVLTFKQVAQLADTLTDLGISEFVNHRFNTDQTHFKIVFADFKIFVTQQGLLAWDFFPGHFLYPNAKLIYQFLESILE